MTESSPPVLLVDALRTFLGSRGGLSRVQRLDVPRLVSDHCDKFIAYDEQGSPSAFVVFSPPSHPTVVAVAAARARDAKAALGNELGDAVLAPWHVGELDGASFSITRFCPPLSKTRWVGRWQRWRLAPRAFDWIAAVARHTAAELSDAQQESLFAVPLRALAANRRVATDVQGAALAALEDLDAGTWRPRSVLSHNDFWWGNLVLSPDARRARAPFFVIDWAGSTVSGHAVYDLVRLALSLNLSRRRLHSELARHGRILRCDARQTMHYLMAALGGLSENLGEWPVEQFVGTASNCHRCVRDAI